jgi:hypothetical protein
MITTASQIFNFLRGAVRSSFGVEDFRGKRIIIVGMDKEGQDLLSMLCLDDVKLYFHDKSIVNYHQAHLVCGAVDVLVPGEVFGDIDILINLVEGYLTVDGNVSKDFTLDEIGDEPYEQGIHEFYFQ